ncbi:MAG: response regulator [Actinomycetota bacterium]
MTADVLIVEDHASMREAMRAVLEQEGFEIREAADGDAAKSRIEDRTPDLIFLDLNIPGTSGEDLLQWVKQDPGRSTARVIIVTATGDEGKEQVIELGADAYFTKPFSPLALLRTVEEVLGPPAK